MLWLLPCNKIIVKPDNTHPNPMKIIPKTRQHRFILSVSVIPLLHEFKHTLISKLFSQKRASYCTLVPISSLFGTLFRCSELGDRSMILSFVFDIIIISYFYRFTM